MYGKTHCGYCKMAKQLFRDENIDYREKDLDLIRVQMMNNDKFQVCFEFNTNLVHFKEYINGLVYTTRQTTVPQIFICGEFIGGKHF